MDAKMKTSRVPGGADAPSHLTPLHFLSRAQKSLTNKVSRKYDITL